MIHAEHTAGDRDRLVVRQVAVPVDVQLVRVGRARVAVRAAQGGRLVLVDRRGHRERVERRGQIRNGRGVVVGAHVALAVGNGQRRHISLVVLRRETEGWVSTGVIRVAVLGDPPVIGYRALLAGERGPQCDLGALRTGSGTVDRHTDRDGKVAVAGRDGESTVIEPTANAQHAGTCRRVGRHVEVEDYQVARAAGVRTAAGERHDDHAGRIRHVLDQGPVGQ